MFVPASHLVTRRQAGAVAVSPQADALQGQLLETGGAQDRGVGAQCPAGASLGLQSDLAQVPVFGPEPVVAYLDQLRPGQPEDPQPPAADE